MTQKPFFSHDSCIKQQATPSPLNVVLINLVKKRRKNNRTLNQQSQLAIYSKHSLKKGESSANDLSTI